MIYVPPPLPPPRLGLVVLAVTVCAVIGVAYFIALAWVLDGVIH